MRRSLIILLILDVVAACALIINVESLIEGVEVEADGLPGIVKELAKPDSGGDRRTEMAEYVERSLVSRRDEAQSVRVVVQIIALLLVINAAFCWYVRRRWVASTASRPDL